MLINFIGMYCLFHMKEDASCITTPTLVGVVVMLPLKFLTHTILAGHGWAPHTCPPSELKTFWGNFIAEGLSRSGIWWESVWCNQNPSLSYLLRSVNKHELVWNMSLHINYSKYIQGMTDKAKQQQMFTNMPVKKLQVVPCGAINPSWLCGGVVWNAAPSCLYACL